MRSRRKEIQNTPFEDAYSSREKIVQKLDCIYVYTFADGFPCYYATTGERRETEIRSYIPSHIGIEIRSGESRRRETITTFDVAAIATASRLRKLGRY